MNLFIFLLLSLSMLVNVQTAQAQSLINPGYIDKPAWFKNSFLDLGEDINEATANKKRLILYFYQDGCPYCAKLIQQNFGQRDINQYTQQHYDIVAINMWGNKNITDEKGNESSEKAFAKQLKVMYTPTFLFFNETKDVILRINGYFPPHKFFTALKYIAEKQETKITYADYFKQHHIETSNKSVTINAEFLQPPYKLSSLSTAKPLMVIFNQAACLACDELQEDILRRKRSQALLSAFHVVVLDRWSNKLLIDFKGEIISAKEWADKLAIAYTPSILYFQDKAEVFRSEAYLKAFHIQSALDYVATRAYKKNPEFQRYLSLRADKLEAQGLHINIMQ